MKPGAASDRAYAKRTAKALAQTKVWRIERVRGDQKCAKRLNTITNELGGIVLEAAAIPTTETWVILWWTWSDGK